MPEGAEGSKGQQGGMGLHPSRRVPVYFLRMPRLRTLTFFAVCFAACSSPAPKSAPAPAEHALSGIAAERVAVLPTYIARVEAPLDWSIGRPVELQRTLDREIAAAFDERGLKRNWIFPDQLAQSARLNPTMLVDPYALAEEPLRAPSLAVDTRLPIQIGDQLRKLVAFHQDVRLVLAPVELRVVPTPPRGGKGVLRVVLIDARTQSVRWIGDIESEPLESFGPALSASIAARLAGVISPR